MDEQEFMRQEHCAHIRQTHLIEDLLRCGGLPGRKVGVILVVALAERSGAGRCTKSYRSTEFDVF